MVLSKSYKVIGLMHRASHSPDSQGYKINSCVC